jgi:hypothetical protein
MIISQINGICDCKLIFETTSVDRETMAALTIVLPIMMVISSFEESCKSTAACFSEGLELVDKLLMLEAVNEKYAVSEPEKNADNPNKTINSTKMSKDAGSKTF